MEPGSYDKQAEIDGSDRLVCLSFTSILRLTRGARQYTYGRVGIIVPVSIDVVEWGDVGDSIRHLEE